jgi:hypothetical protein
LISVIGRLYEQENWMQTKLLFWVGIYLEYQQQKDLIEIVLLSAGLFCFNFIISLKYIWHITNMYYQLYNSE